MTISLVRRNIFCFQFLANFTSCHFTVIFPWLGFQVFYLSRNILNRTIESGYRIYSKGMRDLVEGESLPVCEEWIIRESDLQTVRP